MTPLKALVFDVETSPIIAWVWQSGDQYVRANQLEHETFMLSWAAKWLGQQKVRSQVLTSDEAVDRKDDRIVAGLADLIRQADVLIAHNGAKFDLPVVNARLLQHQLEPVSPAPMYDTYLMARRSFRLASKSLEHLAGVLGLGSKHDTDFDLWKDCYRGDEKALRRMDRYCRQDVRLLEQVFERMKPYVKNLPRMVSGDYEGERCCPACGSVSSQKRGTTVSNAASYPRFQCQDCGRWWKGRSAVKANRLAGVPL